MCAQVYPIQMKSVESTGKILFMPRSKLRFSLYGLSYSHTHEYLLLISTNMKFLCGYITNVHCKTFHQAKILRLGMTNRCNKLTSIYTYK
jgi:hypothetical protein